MLSQLTGDMYEFYQLLKSKCSGVVGVDVTYGKTHYDGSEDVCMTFQLKYHWENEMDKKKDSGVHKIISIMEYIAKKFGWGIDIKWFNSYRAATDDVLMIKLINQKENLTTEVKSKMKKLNITKEAFEKSKYFTKKYGKLEYVSESGKLFKTEKGKVLMFKEGTSVKKKIEKLKSGELFQKQMPSLEKAINKFIASDGVRGQAGTWLLLGDDNGNIRLYEHYGYLTGTITNGHMIWNNEDGFYVSAKYSEMILHALCDGGLIERDECQRAIEDAYAGEEEFERKYGESTKKFGKKFVKESCDEEFDRYYERMKKIFRYDSGIHIRLRDNEDGSETIEVTFDDRFNWNDDVVSGRIPLDEDSGLLDWITRFDEQAHRNGWEFDYDIAKDIESPIDGGANNDYLAMLTLTCKCDKGEVEDDKLFESSVGEGETGTMAKVNDLVSKAYASLYDELKKAGIDFDSASDDGFYVNDPDAQKTYFINLYVNECEEYEGSYK